VFLTGGLGKEFSLKFTQVVGIQVLEVTGLKSVFLAGCNPGTSLLIKVT
jgi:hypothetical protein